MVKALDTIDKGDEIVNCYGIDYRYTEKKKRQDWCRNFFQFTCNCVICRDPKNEFVSSELFYQISFIFVLSFRTSQMAFFALTVA